MQLKTDFWKFAKSQPISLYFSSRRFSLDHWLRSGSCTDKSADCPRTYPCHRCKSAYHYYNGKSSLFCSHSSGRRADSAQSTSRRFRNCTIDPSTFIGFGRSCSNDTLNESCLTWGVVSGQAGVVNEFVVGIRFEEFGDGETFVHVLGKFKYVFIDFLSWVQVFDLFMGVFPGAILVRKQFRVPHNALFLFFRLSSSKNTIVGISIFLLPWLALQIRSHLLGKA